MDKKAMLKAFRAEPRPMGLYQIRHRASGRVYVGRAENLPGLLNSARLQLSVGTFGCQDLQTDYRRDGEAAFDFGVLETLAPSPVPDSRPADDLKVLEELAKDRLKGEGVSGYNF